MQFLDQNVELESRSPIKASKIPCLLFTDDNLAFCRTNFEACRELSTVLCDFYQNSGQLINASTHDKQVVSSVFNITQ